MGEGTDFARFTLTPALATEWLGISSLAVADLIGSGGVDVVMTDDGHTFLDADELAACEGPVLDLNPPATWFSHVVQT